MEFIINKRTTPWGKKPCKETVKKQFMYIDRRTVETLKEAKLPKYKHWSDQFFASGSNFREENGMIARDTELADVWVITLNTLDELMKFNHKYGDLILGFKDCYHGIENTLEIYDDYRE